MRFKLLLLSVCLLLFCGISVMAQTRTITGKVTDNNQSPVPGASVTIKGSETGTVTDENGNFSLNVPQNASTLIISHAAMETREVTITGAPLNVQLRDKLGDLAEVVVIGYGQQKKSLVTGAISSVRAEELENASNIRIDQALQGRTSGVQVVPTSGQPGAGLNIRIRGTGSNRNSSPLYIIDGVRAGGIESIDPSEISSIEILKDAASAAIYGAEGANGVVIISTKTGRLNSSEITYTGQMGIQSVKKDFITMMTAPQYQQYLEEANVAGRPSTADISGIGNGTNWMNAVLRDAPQQHHSLNFSGGSEKSTYMVSGNIFTQEGVVGGDKSRFQRYTLRLNSDHQIKKWIKVGNRFMYSHHKRRAISENDEFGSILGSALLLDPVTPLSYDNNNLPVHVQNAINSGKPLRTDALGNIYGISNFLKGEYGNPLARIDMAKGENVQNKIVGNVFLELSPIKNLVFTSRFGVDAAFQTGHSWRPTFWFSDESQNTIATGSDYNNNWFTWQLENFANYFILTGEHTLNLLAGVSAQKTNEFHMGGSYSGLFKEEDKFSYADFVPDDVDRIGSIGFSRTLASFYGRATYDYAGKYLLTATLRRDGSSLFSPDFKWGTFPSISAGWVFTNENFININNSALSYGKLRASWGQNGSLSSVGLGEWMNSIGAGLLYPDGSGALIVGAAPTSLAYPQLTWETSEQIDVGVDLSFLDNKLSLTMDYFIKKTKDLLTSGNAPMFAGNTLRSVNAGTVENKGFEFEAGYRNRKSRDQFSYEIFANITTIKNNVTYLDPNSPILYGASVGTGWAATAMQVGNPIWYFNGYKTNGIFQSATEIADYLSKTGITGYTPSPGDPIVVDVNGDKQISPGDMTNIGSPHPNLLYGARVNFSYKGFDLLVFAQGQQGNEILMGFNRTDRATANKPAFFFTDRWTGEGSTNSWFAPNGSNPFVYNGDMMIFDGSFMRIRQLQLGYTFSPELLGRANIQRARIYVSLDDFFTFTNYPGVDPEGGSNGINSIGIDRGGYPIPRKALVGLSFSF